MNKTRRRGRAGNVACMGEKRNLFRIFMGKKNERDH
jgi:hypothetical protein